MMAEALTVHLQAKLDEFLSGDEGAKRELIAMAERRLLILARKQMRSFTNETEETAAIVSEAFLRLHGSLDEVRPITIRHFFGLASLQMKRVLLDLARARGRGGKIIGLEDTDQASGLTEKRDNAFQADLVADMYEAIDRLDEELREIVQLLHFQGLTQAEVAVVLGMHEDTVRRKWALARVQLSKYLRAFAE